MAKQEKIEIELFESVKAGFPSPAEDFPHQSLDLGSLLMRNPESTFFARVSGDSMTGKGIDNDDILVIDKSIQPYDGCTAVCFIDGEFTVKTVEMHEDCILLVPANPKYKPIRATRDNQLLIWGLVRFVIKKMK